MSLAVLGILLVALSSLIEGMAHVCLKKSAHATDTKVRWLALGIGFFAAEALIYTVALQWLEIGTAYTLGALAFVATAGFSWWLLNEHIDRDRWIGLALVVVGCGLVAVKG